MRTFATQLSTVLMWLCARPESLLACQKMEAEWQSLSKSWERKDEIEMGNGVGETKEEIKDRDYT